MVEHPAAVRQVLGSTPSVPLVFFIKQWMFKRFTDVQRQKEQESKVVDALPYPNKLGRIFMS